MMRVLSVALLAAAIAVAAVAVGWTTPFFSTGTQEVSADAELRIRAQRLADADVRISAQRLENGRVQFGLRPLTGSGEYAEPVEPRVNSFDPAGVRSGRWLASSSLTLVVDESGRGQFVPSEQFEPAPRTETTLVSGLEGWAGDTRYSAYHDAAGDLVTTVSVYSASTGAPDGELRTTISCRNGETSVTLGGLSSNLGNAASLSQVNVSWDVDGGASASERRAAWPVEGGTELIALADSPLAAALLGAGSTLRLSIATTPALNTTIDLTALSALPVYDNLLHCAGNDGAVSAQSGHTELRIRAMLRDDERIEFAIQQRTNDGWSENILPRSRIMPAFGAATNWLSSTPVSVAVSVAPAHTINPPDPAERAVADALNPILRSGYFTASIAYASDLDDAVNLNSVVTAHGEQGLELQLGCFGGVRRVQLAGAPANSTGAITLAFDDAQATANWNVSASGDAATLRPTDTARTIERLRRASSLAVTVGASAASFDLAGIFETPIQPNIDQCGNYTDPAWRPVTEEQRATTDAGTTYSIEYPEWNDGQRRTDVELRQSGEATGFDASAVRFVIDCRQGRRGFQLTNLPPADGEYTVRSRVDDGEWTDEAWRMFSTELGWSYADFQTDYERLRSGATVEYEIPLSPVVRASFNLTALFGTPVQANIDHCGEDLWPQARTYVPVINVEGQASAAIDYSAQLTAGSTVLTSVTSRTAAAGAPHGSLSFIASCWPTDGLFLYLQPTRMLDGRTTEVTLTVDDRPTETSLWEVGFFGADLSTVFAPEPARLLAQLRGASSVTVEIPASGLEPLVFDLRGMFDTPVQENLDECGYYKPGETRETPPPLNTSGGTQGINEDTFINWSRTQGSGSLPDTSVVEERWIDNQRELGLVLSCGSTGTRLFLWGSLVDALTGAQASVEWSLDGMDAERETWTLSADGPWKFLSPADALPVLALWREAELLDFEVTGTGQFMQRFDLSTIFSVPVIDTFDQCLASPSPEWSLPVTDVPFTTQGALSYAAEPGFGSTWPFSFVRLSASSNQASDGVATTSSRLTVTCGIDGLGIVSDIGSAGGAFISGDTVEVTWRIDNGVPQTGTWAAWPLGQNYRISPADDAAFYAAIQGADSLSVSVASDPVFTQTYDFAGNGFWSTPVQPNLDACGGS